MASTKNCVFVDFETRSKLSIEVGAFAYAAHPSTEILITGIAVEDEPSYCNEDSLGDLLEYAAKGYTLVAHNMLFEIAVLKYCCGLTIVPSQWRCTMQMASRANLPMSLGEATEALNVTAKLATGTALIKLFSIPQKSGEFIEMSSRPREAEFFREYCCGDVDGSREIWRNLREFTPSELLRIQHDLESNISGVEVDWQLATKIFDNCVTEQADFARRVDALTNGVISKMTQVQRIKAWAKTHVNENIPSTDAAHIIEILDGLWGEVDPITREILEMRQHSGKSSTGKYLRFKDSHINGRVLGMIISFGTGTGRTISKLLNLNNLPKPSVEYESMDQLIEDMDKLSTKEINEKYGSYLKAASSAIRGMIKAKKGHTLVAADYASVEARIVAWLANCRPMLKAYEDGLDLYVVMAQVIFGVPYAGVTDDQRWVGKQAVLGCGFGLGWKGFQNTCLKYGREIKDNLCQSTINAYRESYPEIPELWDDLDKGALRACKTGKQVNCANGRIKFKTQKTKSGITFLLMMLPSGRVLQYPDVRLDMVKTPWGERRLAVTYKKVSNGVWRRESTYGGKLTENAVQAIASDCMYYGAQEAKKKGYDVLFSVYDEVIAEVPIEGADIKEFEDVLCELEPWSEGIPLAAEGKILARYQKL